MQKKATFCIKLTQKSVAPKSGFTFLNWLLFWRFLFSKKLVIRKSATKSGIAPILTALKSGFNCTENLSLKPAGTNKVGHFQKQFYLVKCGCYLKSGNYSRVDLHPGFRVRFYINSKHWFLKTLQNVILRPLFSCNVRSLFTSTYWYFERT